MPDVDRHHHDGGDGNYTFSNLNAGTYSVRVVAPLPAGVAPTYDLDGVGTANVASFTLDRGPGPHGRRLRLPRHRLGG